MRQSLGLLLLALLPLAAAGACSRSIRAAVTWLVSVGIAALLVAVPYPLDGVIGLGDYLTYVRDLNEYLSNVFRMEAPLGWALLSLLWRLAGRTDAVAPQAFEWLARLFTCVLLIGLNLLAWREEWSPRVLRYVALCCAAPSMLLFLGYREFAYLPLALAAAGLPLILIGIDRDNPGLILLSALVLGTGAAVHSFGLITLVAAMVAVVAAGQPARVLMAAVVGGTAAWGGWLALLLISGGSLATGHAGNLDLRQLFRDERVEYVQRTKPGLFTVRGMRDVLVMYVMGGLSVAWAVVVDTHRVIRNHTAGDTSARELRAVIAFLVPCLGAAALIWPIQGPAVDTDFIMGLCAAFYAGAWYVAGRSPWKSAVCWLLLAASHPVFWWVVQSREFVN